jgi:DNA-binding CsgD family transcriptional regulator
MAQLALGDDEAARRLTDEDLALARAFGAPRCLGVALCAAGVAEGGDAAEALLRDALTTLAATGARPRRVVLAGVDALTASERRVAELAAQGLTNREIAQSLFITARTVEGHLTNVFRKLDLESREGLAEAMAS